MVAVVKLNAGCGTHYAQGWLNVDVWMDDLTKPDRVVSPREPYPFDNGTFDAVFLGHVLEHIPWPKVPAFIEDMARVAKAGAPMLIVGPDVFRTIKLWAQGIEPWHMVESTLEHQDVNYQPGREHESWDGAYHHWNCHEARLVKLLEAMGYAPESYSDRIPNDPSQKTWHDDETGITWPVVGKHHWQCALLIRGGA